ncbi:MAG: hypothetical protein ACI9XC_001609 [Gammaproteobacteria bacterium]|jgi:hypothetical protein
MYKFQHMVFSISLAISASCFAPLSAQDISQLPEELINWPDTIYFNAMIVSMDDVKLNDNPGSIYQAMAIKGEKILALGTDLRIMSMKGPDTRVFDVQGGMILPGLIDSHLHVQGGFTDLARNLFNLSSVIPGYYISLQVESTPEETLAKIRQAVSELRASTNVDEDQWIGINLKLNDEKGYPSIASVTHMMDAIQPEDRSIRQRDLDEIVSDRMLYFGSGADLESPEINQAFERGSAEDTHNVWFKVSRGANGGGEAERIQQFQWQANMTFPQAEPHFLNGLARDHEAGIIAEDAAAAHRVLVMNTFGFNETDQRYPGPLADVLNKVPVGLVNPGGEGIIKDTQIRAQVIPQAWTDMPNPYQLAQAIIVQSSQNHTLWSGGITQIHTRLDTGEEVTAYYSLLQDRGRLPYRLGWHYEQHILPSVTIPATRQLYETIGAQQLSMKNSSPWLWLLGVGSEGDGDSVTRACLGPLLNALPGKEDYVKNVIEICPAWVKGEENMAPTGEAMLRALKAGWKIQGLHGIGSYMIQLFGERLDDLMAANPDMTLERIRSMRHSFSHGTMLGKVPEVVDAALKYNLYLPVDVGRSLVDETAAIEEFYGPEGYEFQAPIKSLVDAGVEVLSDAAGFQDVETIVTRAHPYTGEIYEPNERVDRVTAIKLQLIQAAKFNMSEELTGTLERGKFADFILIDRDFLDTSAVPDDEIGEIKVLMTQIGGEVVWTADNAPEEFRELPHFWDQ